MNDTIRCLLLLLAALPAGAQPATGEPDVPRMTIAALAVARGEGRVLVVDVRDAASYAAGHIAGAISIPERDLASQAEKLKAEKRVIVTYCG